MQQSKITGSGPQKSGMSSLDISITSMSTHLVIGYGATVTVVATGSDVSNHDINVYLDVNGIKVATTPVTNGQAIFNFTASDLPSTPGTYNICAEVDDELIDTTPLIIRNLISHAYEFIAKKTIDGKIEAIFFEEIAAGSTFAAKVNGVTKSAYITNDNLSVIIDMPFSQLTNGTVILFEGVKLPLAFPSYTLKYQLTYSTVASDDYPDYYWEAGNEPFAAPGTPLIKNGTINRKFDDDWMSFTADDDYASCALQFTASNTPVKFSLYDDDLVLITNSWNTTFSLVDGETYFIKVWHDTDKTYANTSYTVLLEIENTIVSMIEDDHPNVASEAVLLMLNPYAINKIGGNMDYAGDDDWFAVQNTTDMDYSFFMASPNENVNMAIYDENLILLSASGGYVGELEAWETYYIKISYNSNAEFKQSRYGIQIGKVTENPSTEILVDAKFGKIYNLSLNVQKATDIGAKSFTISYNPQELQLVDVAAQTTANDLSIGAVPNTDLTIVSHSNGVLVLQVNRQAAAAYTGVVSVLRFSGLIDDISEITIS